MGINIKIRFVRTLWRNILWRFHLDPHALNILNIRDHVICKLLTLASIDINLLGQNKVHSAIRFTDKSFQITLL